MVAEVRSLFGAPLSLELLLELYCGVELTLHLHICIQV